jgi:hypothetical protein
LAFGKKTSGQKISGQKPDRKGGAMRYIYK